MLVMGLGNPGMKYKNTYHNVGFMVIDALCKRLKVKADVKECDALTCKANYKGVDFVVAKPQTYMNLSGEAVKKLVRKYGVDEQNELIVCYDDIDLPIGKLRIREEGSAGTHNGMRNIIYLLGRTDFPRIRVGIGRPPEGWELCDFVLTRPTGDEDKKLMNEGYEKAAQAVEIYLKDGLDAVRTFVGR